MVIRGMTEGEVGKGKDVNATAEVEPVNAARQEMNQATMIKESNRAGHMRAKMNNSRYISKRLS